MEDHTSKSMCTVQSLLGGLIEKKGGQSWKGRVWGFGLLGGVRKKGWGCVQLKYNVENYQRTNKMRKNSF